MISAAHTVDFRRLIIIDLSGYQEKLVHEIQLEQFEENATYLKAGIKEHVTVRYNVVTGKMGQ